MKYKLLAKTVILLLLVLPVAQGNAIEQRSYERDTESYQHPKRCHDFITSIKLTMEDANGLSSVYRMRLGVKKDNGNCVKKLFIVDSPKNLKGTTLLIHSFEDRQNEQWLYLSARRRVKRIRPCFQSGKFLNSEWTYEDMGGHHTKKHTEAWSRENTADYGN